MELDVNLNGFIEEVEQGEVNKSILWDEQQKYGLSSLNEKTIASEDKISVPYVACGHASTYTKLYMNQSIEPNDNQGAVSIGNNLYLNLSHTPCTIVSHSALLSIL